MWGRMRRWPAWGINALLLVAVAGCTSTSSEGSLTGTSTTVVGSLAPTTTVADTITTTVPTTTKERPLPTTTATTTTTTTSPSIVDPATLADISFTSVPADVIRPTSDLTLDAAANPINGRRGGQRPLDEYRACALDDATACLTATLDTLGFDVSSGSATERERRVQRAIAVVQLDAGLAVTGIADIETMHYLGIPRTAIDGPPADEVRLIGTSAGGREINAVRYGDGPRVVLVVGQTHGDEEGGLRVWLRAQSLPIPDGVTLWVVATMNPDGSVDDTRFLDNGADPNRKAASQPEQQAVYDFALDIRPSLTVWYHQNYGWVGASGASVQPAQRYQELTGLGNLRRSGDCAKGFMWCPIDVALASSSILVELPDVLTPADVQIHASALLRVAAELDR